MGPMLSRTRRPGPPSSPSEPESNRSNPPRPAGHLEDDCRDARAPPAGKLGPMHAATQAGETPVPPGGARDLDRVRVLPPLKYGPRLKGPHG